MKRSSVYVAAGLFLAAVAVKLLVPENTSGKEAVYPTAAVTAEASQENTASAAETARTEAVTVTINAAEYLGIDRYAALNKELPEPVEKAVETFLDDQAPYEDLGIPANVSYDILKPSFRFVCPVKAATSSGFGYRVHPLENLTKFHYGTDLAALSGDDILCFADGTVKEVGSDEMNGRFIRISHAEGFESMYAHCGTVYVREGQSVRAGEKIALVGVSGRVTGPHLHFELTKNGTYLNPEFYFAAL